MCWPTLPEISPARRSLPPPVRILLLIVGLFISTTGMVVADDGDPLPLLPEVVDGRTITQRYAGRLVYLPGDPVITRRVVGDWNRGRILMGEAPDGRHCIPTEEMIYGPGRLDSPWLLEEGLTAVRGRTAAARYTLWQATSLPGVILLVTPAATAGLGDLATAIQAFVDETCRADGLPPPRPGAVVSSRVGPAVDLALDRLIGVSGIHQAGLDWRPYVMILVGLLLLWLGIAKGVEPLLLVPIAFGCLLVNAAGAHIADPPDSVTPGILGLLYVYGVESGIFPLLILLGVGALTDFGPLLANPWSALLGGAAQIGIFGTFFLAVLVSALLPDAWGIDFSPREAAAVAIVGGADGPAAIFVSARLAPHLLGAVAIAAYAYMALGPFLQPPIMRLCTTLVERRVMMRQSREVSRRVRIAFPVCCTLVCILLLPSAVPLIGLLMFGNLLRECRVTDRLLKSVQNELINLVTIALGLTVGTRLAADAFLRPATLAIIVLGCIAFMVGTAGGVMLGKLMYRLSGGKINPLIGAAGFSSVPISARVVHNVGQQYNPRNFLLMHAMGPNVSGVIGSAVAAGILLALA
jgi:oxaloacetate decarboxylase beta subunit